MIVRRAGGEAVFLPGSYMVLAAEVNGSPVFGFLTETEMAEYEEGDEQRMFETDHAPTQREQRVIQI